MRAGYIPGILLAAVVLPTESARSADTPEIAVEKQQLQQAYQGFFDDGVCGVYGDLGEWQGANWPEGRSVVLKFLQETVLPRYVTDPAAVKDKTSEQMEIEYRMFCGQTRDRTVQIMNNLQAAPATEEARQLKDSLRAAQFLGECKTAGTLNRHREPEHRDPLQRFVVDAVYGKDPKYRQSQPDDEGMKGADVSTLLKDFEADHDRAMQYWRDCDTVAAKLTEILEQLKPAP